MLLRDSVVRIVRMMITLVLYYFLYNLDIFKNSENGKTIPSKFNNNLPTFLVCLFPKISMIYKIAKMQERELFHTVRNFLMTLLLMALCDENFTIFLYSTKLYVT